MTDKIFINYRREDSIGTAGRLHDRLAQAFGQKNLFMDVDSIPAGVDFVADLNSQVAACRVFLAVIGPNWLNAKDESGGRRLDNPDDFVAIEIAAALARDIRVIPVLVDDARMPKADKLPDPIKPLVRRNAVEVRNSQFGRDAETLITRMREALGEKAVGLGRRRVRAIAGVAAVALLLLIGWGGYTFIQHILTTVEQTAEQREAEFKAEQERWAKEAAAAEEKRKAEQAEQTSYWTSWMNQADYQQEFERQRKNRWYASQIEAKLIEGVVKFRGHFEPLPAENFQYYSRHALNDDEFSAADAEYIQKGFKRVYQQRIVVGSRPFNQGTWIKSEGAEQQQVEPRRGAWLGVNIQQVTDEIAKILNITPARGALVAGVADKGPAAGGIEVGDVIVKFDGKDIKEMRDLPRFVADTPVGKDVQVTIIRKGNEYTRVLKLGSLEARAVLRDAIDQGVAANKTGDLDRAIASFSEAIRLDPKYSEAFWHRGAVYAKKGDNNRAIGDYDEAIRLNPMAGYAFVSRGTAYAGKGDYDHAIADYSEAIRVNAKNASALNNRGIAYDGKGDYDHAIADYSEAIRVDPKNAIAFNNRGISYGNKSDPDRAIADYSEAIRLDPNYARAFCNRGRAKLKINDTSGNEDIAKARQLNVSACQ